MQVASPGGTTIEGIHELEKGALRGTLMNAVRAAAEKSSEARTRVSRCFDYAPPSAYRKTGSPYLACLDRSGDCGVERARGAPGLGAREGDPGSLASALAAGRGRCPGLPARPGGRLPGAKGAPRASAIMAVFVGGLLLIGALFGSVVPHLINENRPTGLAHPRLTPTGWPSPWGNGSTVRHPGWSGLLEREQGNHAKPPKAARPVRPTGSSHPAPARPKPPSPTPRPRRSGAESAKQDLQTAVTWLAQSISDVGPWLWGQKERVASWLGVLAGLALIPVYAFSFSEKKRISSSWTDYLPVTDSRFKQELVFMLSSINDYLIAFFRGQVLVAISDGMLYGIGFLAIGLPYALLRGHGGGLDDIPFLGAIVTCCTGVAIAFVQFGDWLHRCWFWGWPLPCNPSKHLSSRPRSWVTVSVCIRSRLSSP